MSGVGLRFGLAERQVPRKADIGQSTTGHHFAVGTAGGFRTTQLCPKDLPGQRARRQYVRHEASGVHRFSAARRQVGRSRCKRNSRRA
jgi:hypothetical protein